MYATAEEMRVRWGQELISQLSADDDTLLEAVLAEVSAEINTVLAGHYVMPPSPVPTFLKSICLLLALAKLYDPGSLPESLASIQAHERLVLQEFAEGKRVSAELVPHQTLARQQQKEAQHQPALRETDEAKLQGFGR